MRRPAIGEGLRGAAGQGPGGGSLLDLPLTYGDLLRGQAATVIGAVARALAAALSAWREAKAAEAAILATATAIPAVVRGSAWAAARTRRHPWAFQHGSKLRTEACVAMASSNKADLTKPPAVLIAWIATARFGCKSTCSAQNRAWHHQVQFVLRRVLLMA